MFTSLKSAAPIITAMMKANQKAKSHAPPRPLFSCGFFRRCTQSVLSPTSPHQKPLRKPTTTPSSSSSSSTSTSQSFTQWRFPHHVDQTPSTITLPPTPPPPPLPVATTLQETFQIVELHLTSVSESDKLLALQLLERVVVPDPPSEPTCPPSLMRGLVSCLRSISNNNAVTAKYVTKILLALCLAEGNRHVAVEAGAA